MTNARLRYNGVATGSAGSLADLTLSGSHNNSTTTLTFNAALTYNNGTAVPTLANGDYFMLSILDSAGHVAEIVKVTAYTTAGTTATVVRGQEGTSGVAHAAGAKVVHGPTGFDANGGPALLATTTLASTATTITFSSSDLPSSTSGYKHIQVKLLGRTNGTGTSESILIYLNGSSTSTDYRTKWFYHASSFDTSVTNSAYAGFLGTSGATANRAGYCSVEIMNFADTTFHKVGLSSFYSPATTAPVMGSCTFEYFTTAAITSIAFTPVSASSFIAGTTASLYGLP